MLISDVMYRFNHLWYLSPLMDKLDSCTRLSRKLRIYRDICRPWHSTLVKQQYIGKTTIVVSIFLRLKYLLQDLPHWHFCLLSTIKLTMVFSFLNMKSLVLFRKICAPNHYQVQLSVGVLNVWLGSDSITLVIHNTINSWDYISLLWPKRIMVCV